MAAANAVYSKLLNSILHASFTIKIGLGICITILIISTIGLIKINSLIDQSSSANKQDELQIIDSSELTNMIMVDLEGAVEQPGVYELPENSRLINLLQKAKGLSQQSDRYIIAKTFNLAKKLTDEEKIYIPFVQERQISIPNTLEKNVISINVSTQTQLELLPSIGPVLAQKIINNRPYNSINELVTKKAIGEGTFEKIKSLISL